MNELRPWVTILDSRDPKFFVKGHELAAILYGRNCRFQILEVRDYDPKNPAVVFYRARDAETVTDAEVRGGVRPRVVYEAGTFDEVRAWCDREEARCGTG